MHIQADNDEDLAKGVDVIRKLLVPQDDATNLHKSRQLRELAAINGTSRDEVKCGNCGNTGHKMYECPNRQGQGWTAANVTCSICGANTHIAKDCTANANSAAIGVGAPDINEEYDSFMAELTGGAGAGEGAGGGVKGFVKGPAVPSGGPPAKPVAVERIGFGPGEQMSSLPSRISVCFPRRILMSHR